MTEWDQREVTGVRGNYVISFGLAQQDPSLQCDYKEIETLPFLLQEKLSRRPYGGTQDRKKKISDRGKFGNMRIANWP